MGNLGWAPFVYVPVEFYLLIETTLNFIPLPLSAKLYSSPYRSHHITSQWSVHICLFVATILVKDSMCVQYSLAFS